MTRIKLLITLLTKSHDPLSRVFAGLYWAFDDLFKRAGWVRLIRVSFGVSGVGFLSSYWGRLLSHHTFVNSS